MINEKKSKPSANCKENICALGMAMAIAQKKHLYGTGCPFLSVGRFFSKEGLYNCKINVPQKQSCNP
jgi:hypothetical protein